MSSKRKGNGFENKVKAMILKAFEPFGITPTDAFKSVLSGAHKNSCGDISLSSALAELFPFAVEAKFHKKFDWEDFFIPIAELNKSSKLKRWWLQTLEGAEKSKGTLGPLLVFKANNTQIYAVGLEDSIMRASSTKNLYDRTFENSYNPSVSNYWPSGTADEHLLKVVVLRFDVLLKMLVKKQLKLRKKESKNGSSVSRLKRN